MGLCGCGDGATKEDLFKDASKRYCTDIFFLILWFVALAAAIVLCAVSVNENPSLIIDVVYPPDSYGNNCGRNEMSGRRKLVYPRLDSDISEQMTVVASGQWWNFNPTTLCAAECPSGFDLSNPVTYGGADYHCGNCAAGTTVPEYYYTFVTQDMIDRCIVTAATAPAETRDICVIPSCSTVMDPSYTWSDPSARPAACAVVDSQPSATNTWEVCPSGTSSTVCAVQRAACTGNGTLEVREDVTEEFTPSTQTDADRGYTRTWAGYVQMVLGGYEGLVVTEGVIAWSVFGLVLPVVMAFVWAIFLWFFAGIIVYVLILSLIVLLVVLDVVLCVKAGFFSLDAALDGVLPTNATLPISTDADETWQTWYMVLAVLSIIVTVAVVVFVVLYRQCIYRLIAIIEEVTKVFRSMILIVVWPLFDLGLQAITFVFGFFALYFAANAPDSLFSDDGWKIFAVTFLVLFIFWTSQFARASIWTSMSAAICRWYVTDNAVFTEKKCCGLGTGLPALCSGTGLIFSKHLGSMAFGALIIAVIQTIRAAVAAVDYYTQDLQKGNCLLKLVFRCVQCCLACIQKTIELISYYGFVFVAMKGDNFCKACGNTFVFIMKYPAQTAVNKTVATLLNIMIGWTTPVGCAALAFLYLEYGAGDYPDKFNTLWAAGVTFIFSFVVTAGVTMVYGCAIDTIYLCAFDDMENPAGPKYMSNDLRAGFGLDKAHEEASKAAQKYKPLTQRRKEKVSEVEVKAPASTPQVDATSNVA